MAPHGITLYHGLEIFERDRAFLDRSRTRIANESKVKNKTVNNEPSPGIRKTQDRMGHRWNVYAIRPLCKILDRLIYTVTWQVIQEHR
jgi:hypothetical protein